jgi:hypothetical protein
VATRRRTREQTPEDEARIGLIPIKRRVRSPVGKQPEMCSRRRYPWRNVFGFVHPAPGRTELWIATTISTAGVNEGLAKFAESAEVGPNRRIVLVLDGAGWRSSKSIRVPDGLHLVAQPPYLPEVQPSERRWPLLRESPANRDYVDLDEITEVVNPRCREISDQPSAVSAHTRFYRWPGDRQPRALRADS